MSITKLNVSTGLNISCFVKNYPYSIILRSKISLTRHSSRFIYAITIKIIFRDPSMKIEGSKLSRNIRLEERGVLNSCDSVN